MVIFHSYVSHYQRVFPEHLVDVLHRPCFLPAPHHPALHRETRRLGLRRPGGAHCGEARNKGGNGGKAVKLRGDPWKTWKNFRKTVKNTENTDILNRRCSSYFESEICLRNLNNNLGETSGGTHPGSCQESSEHGHCAEFGRTEGVAWYYDGIRNQRIWISTTRMYRTMVGFTIHQHI